MPILLRTSLINDPRNPQEQFPGAELPIEEILITNLELETVWQLLVDTVPPSRAQGIWIADGTVFSELSRFDLADPDNVNRLFQLLCNAFGDTDMQPAIAPVLVFFSNSFDAEGGLTIDTQCLTRIPNGISVVKAMLPEDGDLPRPIREIAVPTFRATAEKQSDLPAQQGTWEGVLELDLAESVLTV